MRGKKTFGPLILCPGCEALPPRRFQSRFVVRSASNARNSLRGVRHKRREQTRKSAYHFKQMMQHFADPRLLGSESLTMVNGAVWTM